MTTKTTVSGREYQVSGRSFTWTTDEDTTVTIPLRIKLKTLRGVGAARDNLDTEAMFTLIGALAPDAVEAIDEMDVNDFTEMFSTWQHEYQLLSGASLGEASRSSG